MFILPTSMFADKQEQKQLVFEQFKNVTKEETEFIFQSILTHCKSLEWRPQAIQLLNQKFGYDIGNVIKQYLPIYILESINQTRSTPSDSEISIHFEEVK